MRKALLLPLNSSASNLNGLGKQVSAFTSEGDSWSIAKTQSELIQNATTM